MNHNLVALIVIQYLLLFLLSLMYSDCTHNQVHYYVTPSANAHCPQHPCLSLAQFAANSSECLGNKSNNITVSLSFLPGTHILDRVLSLSQIYTLSMIKDADAMSVECNSQSGRFNISEMTFATVNGLHFIGCGGNSVSEVEQFIVEDTVFQGVEGRGTALVLHEVTTATIANSSFLTNTHSSTFEHHDISLFYFITSLPNSSLAVGGAVVTAFSNISIVNSQFIHNTAEIGGVLVAHNSSLHISGSTYSYNRASFGGVIITSESSININNSTFIKNQANISAVIISFKDAVNIISSTHTDNIAFNSGVIMTFESIFSITDSIFSNNRVLRNGPGVIATINGSFNINSSTFINNYAHHDGGVIYSSDSSFKIVSSMFISNSAARDGGVMYSSGSSLNVFSSTFTNNRVVHHGGVMSISHSSLNITSSTFNNNTADCDSGVMAISGSSFNIISCSFDNNSAARNSGVMDTNDSSFNIASSNFTNNDGGNFSGVIDTINSSFYITSSIFTNNSVTFSGSVAYGEKSSFIIAGSKFYANKALNYGGIMFTVECSIHITESMFARNTGSLYIFNSNLTISGYTRFENSAEPSNKIAIEGVYTRPHQEGGVITSFKSTVLFSGVSNLSNNHARNGGAILATESKIILYGETTISKNIATNKTGGGISLHRSYIEIRGHCIISNNYAMKGGGILAASSTVAVYQPWILEFINNTAENGSGLYLENNANLYILKSYGHNERPLLIFRGNNATHKGAMYVADDTNYGACSSENQCFIQILALYRKNNSLLNISNMIIHFSVNTAISKQGANLFGGLLDRCLPSPFAEAPQTTTSSYNIGVGYLANISNIQTLDMVTISSLPVRICFCKNKSEPDCSFQPPTIKVKKGEAFNVSLVAVDHIYHAIDSNIISYPSSPEGGFSEGQRVQSVRENCTNITFNVYSPHNTEKVNLFADGPCRNSILSTRQVDIQFTNCTCPVGFEPLNKEERCECICDFKLSRYITGCNSTTDSLIRVNTNSWITFISDTEQPGYIIHPNCPFDYCQLPTDNISMNLNLPNGADAQCAYNRSGVLCGKCQDHLSLSLGSSCCLPCHNHWPVVFVVIFLAAIIAGLLLVTAMLAVNMTVAIGLINGFIFYANIVAANSAIFFPSSEPRFPTVFVAWLNLDIGIDVCFFDGLDAYTKTWLQLAFPVYIISLVIVIIILSEVSTRFAKLIGRRDPIATLATLILLSYAKLLSVTITALSLAVLDYPDGSREIVWLPDGNVKYFQGKHIVLVFVALLVILIGVPYTITLFLWQWLVRAPNWRILQWTRNTKLNTLVSVHHVPYNSKYRYWTGLLLLVRVVLYIISSVTVSGNPQTSLLVTIILVGSLFFLRELLGARTYTKLTVNVIETIIFFNLLTSSALSLHHLKNDNIRKQTAVAYISTIITFMLFVGVVIYHLFLPIRKEKLPGPDECDVNDQFLQALVHPANAESSLAFPDPSNRSLGSQVDYSNVD